MRGWGSRLRTGSRRRLVETQSLHLSDYIFCPATSSSSPLRTTAFQSKIVPVSFGWDPARMSKEAARLTRSTGPRCCSSTEYDSARAHTADARLGKERYPRPTGHGRENGACDRARLRRIPPTRRYYDRQLLLRRLKVLSLGRRLCLAVARGRRTRGHPRSRRARSSLLVSPMGAAFVAYG